VTLGVKLVTQLTNRGLNAKWAEQWDRYHVPQNAFLVNNQFTETLCQNILRNIDQCSIIGFYIDRKILYKVLKTTRIISFRQRH